MAIIQTNHPTLIPSASVLLSKKLGLIPEAGGGQSPRKSNKYRALINMQKIRNNCITLLNLGIL